MSVAVVTARPCAECLFQNYWRAGDATVAGGMCLHPKRQFVACSDERARWGVVEQAFPSLRQRCGPAGGHWAGRPRFLTIIKL